MSATAEQVQELAIVGAPSDWDHRSWVKNTAAQVGYDVNVLPSISVARTHLHSGLGGTLIMPDQTNPGLFGRRAARDREQTLSEYGAKARELGIPVGTLVIRSLSGSGWYLTVGEGFGQEAEEGADTPLTDWLNGLGTDVQA